MPIEKSQTLLRKCFEKLIKKEISLGAVCREKLLNMIKQVRVKGKKSRKKKILLVDYWQDREGSGGKKQPKKQTKKPPIVGSMAGRELGRREVDDGICEVICYGHKILHKVKVKIHRSIPLKKLKKILYFEITL